MKYFNLEEYLQQLKLLVNIDSGSKMPEGTGKIADYLEEQYKALGLSVIRRQVSDAVGPCLEIRNRPESERIDLLLMGHMDTVFPAGTVEKRPFTVEEGYAYGPGVMDMKGGLVSMLFLVREILGEGLDLSVCVAMNSDEEISSNASKEWIKELARRAEYAFVMEPGRKNGEYVCERKGLAKFHVKATGIAAHAGVAPWDGASAIHELAHMILKIINLTNRERGTNINVGTITGGTAPNVVSRYAECLIDTRFDEIAEYEKIEKTLEELAGNPADTRVKIECIREGFRPPMRMTERTKKLMRWMDEKGADLGMAVKWVKTGGVSDGNFVAFEGCAVIDGVGPAGDGAHSDREILQVGTVEKRLELALETVREIEKEAGKEGV